MKEKDIFYDEIDIPEMEKQRYDAIKETGKFMELSVLLGVEEESIISESISTQSPVVTFHMKGSGLKETAAMYAILKQLVKTFEKKYPLECCISNLAISVQDLGSTETAKKKKEK